MVATSQEQLSNTDKEKAFHEDKNKEPSDKKATHEDKKKLCFFVAIVAIVVFIVAGIVVGWELRLRQFDDTAKNSSISSSRSVSRPAFDSDFIGGSRPAEDRFRAEPDLC